MGKAVLSNRIYLTKTSDLFAKCMKALTYKIPPKNGIGSSTVILDVVLVSDSVFSIPIGRQDLIPKDYTIIDKRVRAPITFTDTQINLREDQSEIVDQIDDSCLINAKPGYGKTFVALHVAKKLGQKTLIVVHNKVLRDQWVEETEKIFGYEPDTIGSGVFNCDTDIVVSNTQTLCKVVHEYNKKFGTVIMDECHRLPSAMFKKVADAMYSRYKIGLSATINRKDNKHIIIPDYFSPKRLIPENDTAMTPTVYTIFTKIKFPESYHYVDQVTKLLALPEYRKLIIDIVNVKANVDNHKVLCVSDRVEFIHACAEAIPNSVAVTAKTEGRKEIHKEFYKEDSYTSLIGTSSIYKEGISINPLSCLVLSVPINNSPLLEQVIGRITRPHPGKREPEIIDIVIKGHSPKRAYAQRRNYYISKGYKIVDIYYD